MTIPRILALVCAVAAAIPGCAGAGRHTAAGWVGDDAYRVAFNVPAVMRIARPSGGELKVSRRETVQKAISDARERVLQDLVAVRVRRDDTPGARQRAWLQLTLDRELRAALSRGVVEHRRFRKDNTLDMVFRVELQGLRGRIEGRPAAQGEK